MKGNVLWIGVCFLEKKKNILMGGNRNKKERDLKVIEEVKR